MSELGHQVGAGDVPELLPRAVVVAIDGPSGSGKSTIGRHLAEHFGLGFLDTGAMFRALAWYCLEQGVDLTAPRRTQADAAGAGGRAGASGPVDPVDDAVARLALELPLAEPLDPRQQVFRVGGVDVTAAIRTTEISTVVSRVATNLAVRAELRRRQRALIAAETLPAGWSRGRGIVAEGRDITTVIAPDADVRLLLVAGEEARLARRAKELFGSTDAAAIAATRDQVVRRDADDSTVSQFLQAADGVHTLDSSELGLSETCALAEGFVREAVGA